MTAAPSPVHWQGHWITSGDDGPVAPLLRREFTVPAGAVAGLLHVAGLGLHRTTLDGRPVSDARLESGISAYDRRIAHSSYPVALEPGPSVLGVELGRGFYAMTTPNVWGWHQAPWRGLRMALVQLELLDADGERLGLVVSDDAWRWSPGGTRFDSLYEGETFDARREPAGWDRPGFDATRWQPVQRGTPPGGLLVRRAHEPVRVTASHPVAAWSGGGGAPLVADFGRQLAGWVKVTARDLDAGRRVTLRLGERADASGVLLENPHVHAERLDVHELVVGEGGGSWEPRFTWTGFRYAEVSGIEHPDQLELLAQHAHNDVATASTFTCSDDVLTWIDTAMRATVVNNLHHLPTDTPVYEKNGWTGDAQVALEAMLHQFDLQHLLVKWLDDLADGQAEDGQLPVIAPTPGWGYLEAPEWTTLYPYLLERLDSWYGVPEVVARHLEPLQRYLRRELARVDASGLVVGVLGDYLAPGTAGTPPEDDLRIAASCYLVRGLRAGAALLERHAAGGHGAAARFRRSADALASAVNRTFLDPVAGCYRSEREPRYRQASNIVPVAFGITPPGQVDAVVERLVEDLEARGLRHDTGCLGLSELFGVLTRGGRPDVALAVATGTEAPSWGAWKEAGETTMLEMWGPVERSRNHYFMGAMARWLYEDVAGVRMSAPQWREFIVAPALTGSGLEHAAYHRDGPRGRLGAAWRRTGAEVEVTVTVPPGSTAHLHLPGTAPFSVSSGEWRYKHATSIFNKSGDYRRAPFMMRKSISAATG